MSELVEKSSVSEWCGILILKKYMFWASTRALTKVQGEYSSSKLLG